MPGNRYDKIYRTGDHGHCQNYLLIKLAVYFAFAKKMQFIYPAVRPARFKKLYI
jgi:hypothetical protein